MVGDVKFVCRECFRFVFLEADSEESYEKSCPNCGEQYQIDLIIKRL